MKLFQGPEDVAFNVAANEPSEGNILGLSIQAENAAELVLGGNDLTNEARFQM